MKTTTRNKILIILIAAILFTVLCMLANHDDFYSKPIVRINAVEEELSGTSHDEHGNSENRYSQYITGTIANGSYKGQTVSFYNSYYYSETNTFRYFKGDKLFVSIKETDSHDISISPVAPKTDRVIYIVTAFFILLLVFMFKTRGFLTLLSVILNALLFFFCLTFYEEQIFYDWLWILLIICFVTITLVFVSGFHKKTFGAIFSSLSTILIVSILYYLVVYRNTDMPYDMLPCIIPDASLNMLFLISTLFGLLGAVMDISITINSTVSELIETNNSLTTHKVIGSIKELGYDIMGTMINVLFFSYLSCSFPLVALKLYQGFSVNAVLTNDFVFDITRFLIGSIGIVLAIPISGFVAVLLFRKGMVKEI